ncbi:hypothetical protein [Paenibacillus sp. Leaf72]|uniref:hypothetical protein n=1 Tax=Paenibacillus sp. Leaf72 TaxID=1736234 RepID=UPI0006F7CC71|nr:hypothetical protein [Paenibacillus sp. Leaf72]KQN96008.1 hypothetical protein ASF12_24545 [Paenibacillus sp. Leaf72]
MELKRISIDTNYHYDGHIRPTIPPFVISHFNLRSGDKVIGYQEDQEWEGEIGFNATYPEEKRWYLELENSVEYPVSKERELGRDEGSAAAKPIGEFVGEAKMVEKMLADGMDIDKVFKYTRIPRSTLQGIQSRVLGSKE